LLLSDDLMFTSRVTGTARSLGIAAKTARSVPALEALAREMPPRCVILDLGHAGLSVSELLEHLRQICDPMPRVVGYGSHVDAPGLRAAREAGCDVVLPRSAFAEELPRELPNWVS
jgi:DNA-binding NarL/FixJ family response regulator